MINALNDGIARNQSIQQVFVDSLSNDGFVTIAGVLVNLTQLERFYYRRGYDNVSNDPLNDCVTIGSLLELGVWKLKELSLYDSDISGAGVAAFAHGLRSIGSSLTMLNLTRNDIGSEGLSTLVAALGNCTGMERLNFSCNNFSRAAEGLRSLSLSDWLQTAAFPLDELDLTHCDINDEGLQALTEGAVNRCKGFDLEGNDNITASGLRLLSTSLQSESCRLESLDLGHTGIEDDGAEVLARGLVRNTALKCLYLCHDDEDFISITPAGWSAFSKVLCDTSTINNTYLSNHTIIQLWDGYHQDLEEDMGEDLALYLRMNRKLIPQYAAKCKILMHHSHLDMAPLLQWELKCLPLAIDWFEAAKPCTTLSIYEGDGESMRCPGESEEVFQSRVLTTLYQFVRGVPKKVLERRGELILVSVCDGKVATVEDENKRLRKELEQRERKIAQLEERLREIAQSARNALDY